MTRLRKRFSAKSDDFRQNIDLASGGKKEARDGIIIIIVLIMDYLILL